MAQEVLYHAPVDGTVGQFSPVFAARSADVINSTDKTLKLGLENGDVLVFGAGAVACIPLPKQRAYTLQLATAATNGGSAYVLFRDSPRQTMAGSIPAAAAGGGSAVTIADGADVAQGTTTDVAYVSGAGTIIALLKGLFTKLAGTLTATITGALPAGANVIGHVIADTGSTTAVTGNVTAVQATGTNLHVVADTGSTTAVTGNVTAVQATGTNLHAVLDAASALIGAVSTRGAANIATSQVAASTTAGTLAVARATRRRLLVKNIDAAITITIGPATVTAGNGMPVKAGESVEVFWVGLVQVIAASGTPTVAIQDEFD